ncbi:hypothetical protein [Pseudoalteromonas byunsanensis]|uniref:Uncharacterized protein n=1 Tax=Pseudoalteromonas byunsanensis TaxID=327939 RepID=A0A1S1MX39_9GAMM|nr:hypothetical protein [Pseudoalteromonas byunsanensis]OHU93472.1 hypothetical protein BIW53_19140 [Pseudoalteromonas byunsanensis]
MLINFAFLIGLIQSTPPDLAELKSQFMQEPIELAQRYHQHANLPVNTGSAQFYQLTLRAAIVSNQPELANDISMKLAQPVWQPIIENHKAKLISNMGVLMRINGHYKDAIAAYQCALKLNQKDPHFRFHTLLNLQSVMVRTKQHSKAQQILEEAKLLATDEQQHLRVKINVANSLLDNNQLYQARNLFKELYRDLSLANETETAARIGLNLLNTEVLLGDFTQFWRYQNSVRQTIFAVPNNNHHYYYHFVIMRALVNALVAPNEVHLKRFAYAIEHGDFLFEHGQQHSMQRYVDMINDRELSKQFSEQVAQYERIRPQKHVPRNLLDEHCQTK